MSQTYSYQIVFVHLKLNSVMLINSCVLLIMLFGKHSFHQEKKFELVRKCEALQP